MTSGVYSAKIIYKGEKIQLINNVVLMGRLTYDPELKSTASGISVVSFQVASDRQFQAKGEERKADFIDCTAWRQTAEFISRYFHKGSMIALTGSLQTENYTDKDGNKRKSVTVVVNNVSFCGSKAEDEANTNTGSGKMPGYDDFEEIVDDDDDLPF